MFNRDKEEKVESNTQEEAGDNAPEVVTPVAPTPEVVPDNPAPVEDLAERIAEETPPPAAPIPAHPVVAAPPPDTVPAEPTEVPSESPTQDPEGNRPQVVKPEAPKAD